MTTTTTITEAQALAIGAKPWTYAKGTRYYINLTPEMVGLEIEFYGTGNVRSAKLDGEVVTNGSAAHISRGGRAPVYAA